MSGIPYRSFFLTLIMFSPSFSRVGRSPLSGSFPVLVPPGRGDVLLMSNTSLSSSRLITLLGRRFFSFSFTPKTGEAFPDLSLGGTRSDDEPAPLLSRCMLVDATPVV